jgi:hypothetical protein
LVDFESFDGINPCLIERFAIELFVTTLATKAMKRFSTPILVDRTQG